MYCLQQETNKKEQPPISCEIGFLGVARYLSCSHRPNARSQSNNWPFTSEPIEKEHGACLFILCFIQ
jgi:hypothetical protein